MEKRNAKTAICIVYFGPKPIYLNLFFKGAEFNTDVDFIFFTDWKDVKVDLTNVHFVSTTLHDFETLVRKKTALQDLQLPNAYKLCDLKPAWPHILEDYLVDYDYVGYCDIDLIFGDLNRILKELIPFDVLTGCRSYFSGAFTLLKNKPEILKLYQQARGWDYIFKDKNHWAFDEFLRPDTAEKQHAARQMALESFSNSMARLKDTVCVKCEELGYEMVPGLVEYREGKIVAENTEWAFYHYVLAKKSPFWVIPDWKKVPDTFLVNKTGFYKLNSKPIGKINLLLKPFYMKQVVAGVRSKLPTLLRLIKTMDYKKAIGALKQNIR